MKLYRMCLENSLVLGLVELPAAGKVSPVILSAAETFALATGQDPEYVFMREIPAGAQEFLEVRGMTLLQADWVPAGQVAVGRSGLVPIAEPYRRWRLAEPDRNPAQMFLPQIRKTNYV
jgi:hypothetical protein